MSELPSHVDVLIVGAGLSGIGAAYHLKENCPKKTFAILEGRESLGGTWDLFRYPGVRSDSDMYTLGYSFKPWTGEKAIADGAAILSYLQEAARENGIDRAIHFGNQVKRATWSTAASRWTVESRRTGTGETVRTTCGFLFLCAGYYDYEEGYTPEFPGRDAFRGPIVHPQKWTPDVDVDGKRVIVIGSGATAVTLVPELAKRAAHVTMLQRSPTYVVAAPDRDRIASWMRARLPVGSAYALTRWKNVAFGMAFFAYCRRYPDRAKRFLLGQVRRQLRDRGHLERHFTPTYKPWDQRVCLVPNGDLFATLHSGRASVVTDHIDRFTETGIRLRSGEELPADVIVTATGLKMKLLGGMTLNVDGRDVEAPKTTFYKGMMCSDVPNMAVAIGYTNASWTLKCDLTSEYVCRLLNYMDKRGYAQCVPRRIDPTMKDEPVIAFSSGYVQRSIALWPRQGTAAPWKLYQNYALDLFTLRHATVADPSMEFSSPPR